MLASRARLPAYSCRAEVLSAVAGSDVVVISGATGCGKSTQVGRHWVQGSGFGPNARGSVPQEVAAGDMVQGLLLWTWWDGNDQHWATKGVGLRAAYALCF